MVVAVPVTDYESHLDTNDTEDCTVDIDPIATVIFLETINDEYCR